MSFMGARIKDEKWPATEPEAIHQDVRAGLKPARNLHLGRKKKETNRAQTKGNGKEPKR